MSSLSLRTDRRCRGSRAACSVIVRCVSAAAVTLALAGCVRTEGAQPSERGKPRRDYLDAESRAEVEALKKAVAKEPTTAVTAPERSQALWRWANALALHQGRNLPFDLASYTRQMTLVAFERRSANENLCRRLDLFVRELALKEESPEALGSVRLDTKEPLIAASFATIEQTYVVGGRALEPGATLLVSRQGLPDQGQPQHEDPAGDHYVSIRVGQGRNDDDTSDVRWEKLRLNLPHSNRQEPAFRLASGRLAPGDTVTFTYGDRSGGSRGFQVQSFQTDLLFLPVYVDLAGDGLFLSPSWPPIEVVGQPDVKRVRVLAPSVVAPGERFELSVRSEDEWFNRPSGPIPAYVVLLDGKPWRELRPSRDAVQLIRDARVENEGVHRFTVRTADGTLSATSNPVWAKENPERRVYWGETHGHCGFGEGQGSVESFYRFGRDDARLDFQALTEHDAMLDDWEWSQINEQAHRFHEDGSFVTFVGYEWSAQRTEGGHHNVIFREPGPRRVPLQTHPVLPLLYGGLRVENDFDDVLIIPHAHNAGDWTQSDAQLERLVEVASLHGTFEWFGNLYLKSGFEVGFVGASDDHRAMPGLPLALPKPFPTQNSGIAGVWAEEKTRDAIFDAMRSLSAYATTGERIVLDASLNGLPMGSRQPDSKQRRIECRVAGTSPIDRIAVVKNGTVVFERSYLAAPLAPRSTLQIGFESSSEVFFPPRDNPRPQRVWEGTLDVEGARVVGLSTPGFDNHYRELARLDESDPNRIRFSVRTRGRMDTLLLELEGAGPQTVLRFHLEERTEEGSPAGNVRPPATIPATDFELRLDRLVDGSAEHKLQVGKHVDRVRAQVIDPNAPLDRELAFTDLAPAGAVDSTSLPGAAASASAPADASPAEGGVDDSKRGGGGGPEPPGDYYYVRVTQLDGGLAFSSPFWIGGKRPARPDPDTLTSAPPRDAATAGANR
jgi:hypothetical protein